MKPFALLLCVSLFFLGCKKEKLYKIDASKITAVDENGDPNGENDPTDWRFDDDWNAREIALFNFGDTVSKWGMEKAGYASVGAAPNPTSSVIVFTFMAQKRTFLKWVVTDEYLNVLFQNAQRLENSSNINPNKGFMIDVRNPKFKAPGFYRIYYALYSQDGIIYKKGHGDFKKL